MLKFNKDIGSGSMSFKSPNKTRLDEVYVKPSKEVMDEVFNNEPVVDKPMEINSKEYIEMCDKIIQLEDIVMELKDELFQLSICMVKDIDSINRRLAE